MPYTPPAVQSPVALRVQTPSLPRSFSYSSSQAENPSPWPSEARSVATDIRRSSSQTYLHKHRRSPSITSPPPSRQANAASQSSQLINYDQESRQSQSSRTNHNASNEQLPPTSGTNSSSSSSEDEANAISRGGRELENLAELQDAIRSIEQNRSSSPTEFEQARKTRIALGLELPSGEPTDKARSVKATLPQRPPLTAEARKISHSRSNTETSAILDFSPKQQSLRVSVPPENDFEVVDDIKIGKKPPLLRKKSGEPIRPALRPSSAGKRRPSSMPGTPTYGKAVHFDNHLEHVRTFLQVDRPVAVSAGSSPIENYESDTEFPFSRGPKAPKFEWELRLPNFPTQRPEKAGVPVRMEKIYLSTDTKSLLGLVAVQNLAFHKLVVARFTFDFWQTTSEVKADYSNDARRRQLRDGYDRFIFSVKIADQAHLEKKTMFICIRYTVDGQDFWDNNRAMNYQVDFCKKYVPQHGKHGMQAAASRSLPSGNGEQPVHSTPPRPRSFPSTPDDFANSLDKPFEFSSFPQPSARAFGQSSVNKGKPGSDILPPLPARRSPRAGQAFGNRYDFGASLSAAMQAAGDHLGERSGLPSQTSTQRVPTKQTPPSATLSSPTSSTTNPSIKDEESIDKTHNTTDSKDAMSKSTEASVATPPLLAEKAPIQSSSYNELLNKYCFVCYHSDIDSV